MAAFSEADLLTLLRIQNPWWYSGQVDQSRIRSFHRGEYYLCAYTFFHSLRRFPVLTGPRRVGKSTILFQMIDQLLQNGTEPDQILYISLDTAVLEEAGILKLLMLYRSQITQAEPFFFFVDEVQKDRDWTSVLKFIYDSFPSAKVVATGSASFRIEEQYRETGEGRLRLIRVPTLSFYEYCMLRNTDAAVPDHMNVFQMHREKLSKQSLIITALSVLEPDLNRYLRLGGFPEYVSISQKDESYALSLIEENVINKVIFTDLSTTDRIKPTQLKRVFTYLCNTTSSIMNIEELCRELTGVSNATVVKYIEILESAGLIYCAHQVNSSGKKILKARDKIHIADSGIREAIVSDLHSPDDPVQKGYLMESAAYKHTADYCRCADADLQVGYMLKTGTEKEIDIVIYDHQKILQLIESKFRQHSSIKNSDLIISEGLPDTPGYIVTKSSVDYGLTARSEKSLYRIPAVAYLYLLGKMKYENNMINTL